MKGRLRSSSYFRVGYAGIHPFLRILMDYQPEARYAQMSTRPS